MKQAIDKIMKGEKADINDKSPLGQLQLAMQNKMNDLLWGIDRSQGFRTNSDKYVMSGISDVYGGSTENVVKGRYGHPDIYWEFFSPGLEMFADNFSDGMTGYTNRQQQQQSYLPGASNYLNGDPGKSGDTGVMGDILTEAQTRMGR